MGVIAKNKEDYITFSVKVTVDRYMDKNGVVQQPWPAGPMAMKEIRPSSLDLSTVLSLWHLVWIH